MTYEIVKNKPLPEAMAGGRPRVYPFADMEVGDAFCAGPYTATHANRVASCGRQHGKRCGKKFSQRTVEGELWVWRTA